ncbi:protein mono-ADP-ribosyltransferase PARP9 isoform 2-T2 [Odontesthes bonariensis]|uniref:protein mono-ADP-ribosyltransferase PARP9 isoform X2 n=1 Tax=Odontesthes bonariensis TaxID=219752 RepID=UPI003F58CF25
MASKSDFPVPRSSVNIVKEYRAALSDILNTKFGCVATFDGVDFESELNVAKHGGPAIVPERRVGVTLPSGVQVSVWKGDLTSFSVDAVVNAANIRLEHLGGLAQALSSAGGPKIQRESGDYVYRHGPLTTGDAVVFDAGLLPCKKIIHAVGPELPHYPSTHDVFKAEPLLQKVICSILDRVKEQHLSTVAIPAISSGLFNYPRSECAKTIVSTVKQYYEYVQHGHRPKEIFLMNNDEPTVKEMEGAFHHIFAPSTMTYSQATAKNTRSATKTSPTIQVANVRVTLKKDKIEEQRTDVIVNTASPNRNLREGEISKAISMKAGEGMQKEMYSAHSTGNIVITKGYKLNCSEVYHTLCMSKDQPAAHQFLFTSVFECLCMAAANHRNSIAFPAIGTGNLGFSKKEVARMMLDAVHNFTQTHQTKMDVYFIIFPSDRETFQAFEEQMRSYQPSASHSSFAPAAVDRSDIHSSRGSTPRISLCGPSRESTAEAEKWLTDLFASSSFDIHNNLILHWGEEEHQQLSRLTKGGVSIEEFFTQGHACVTVKGFSRGEAADAVLQVEAMLCNIQRELISEGEREISMLSDTKVSSERLTVDHSRPDFTDRVPTFKKQNLRILKVEKVKNPALQVLFDLKKDQLHCSATQTMFQLIPAQFCEMISRIGFHAECAPPEDPAYGEGIYFAHTLKRAMDLWRQKKEEYLYFVEAEVLMGNATPGKRGLILPPPVGSDADVLYDSVTGGGDISVIFSGYQALPKYIITCKRRDE